jgi:hypothetical protein
MSYGYGFREPGPGRFGAIGGVLGVRGLTYFAAMVFGLAAAPQTASALTVWQGEAVVTSASGNCTFPGDERRNISVGTVLKSVLRPRALDNNGGNTRISFVHDLGAMFVMVLQDTGPNGDYALVGVTHSGLLRKNGLAGFANFSLTPSNMTTDTVFVRASGRVEDFMFLSGCDATFRASYSKR